MLCRVHASAQKGKAAGPGVGYGDPNERTKDALRAVKAAGEDGNEWSSTLYTDGENYYFSELNTDQAQNHVSYPAIPKGFTVDGYVHNHPKGVNPWPSGPEGGVFSDVGFATLRQKPVWNIDHEGYVYRYIPNS